MQRLLYISESRIADADKQSAVSQIVEHAQINNARLGLTGALLFTGLYFAQVLEGPTEAIQTLMADIKTDTRHGKVVVVDESPTTERLFPIGKWRIKARPSLFLGRSKDCCTQRLQPNDNVQPSGLRIWHANLPQRRLNRNNRNTKHRYLLSECCKPSRHHY